MLFAFKHCDALKKQGILEDLRKLHIDSMPFGSFQEQAGWSFYDPEQDIFLKVMRSQ